ncbi:MAG: AAA family ATPase [Mycobacteriales bacterium]
MCPAEPRKLVSETVGNRSKEQSSRSIVSAMSEVVNPTPLRQRFVRSRVEETLQDTPITVLQGARQVGKSTLARQVLGSRGAELVSLDATASYEAARADPDGFVRHVPGLLGIDEVQRVPELLRAKDAVGRGSSARPVPDHGLGEPARSSRHAGEPRGSRGDRRPVRVQPRRSRRRA